MNNLVVIFIFWLLTFATSCYETVHVWRRHPATIINTCKYTEFISEDMDSNFVFQNKDMKLTYELSSSALICTIENNSDFPVYLDVARSAIIVNKISLSYLKALDIKERYYYIPSHSIFVMREFQTQLPDVLEQYKGFNGDTIFTVTTTPVDLRHQITYGYHEDLRTPKMIENRIYLQKIGSCDGAVCESRKSKGLFYTIDKRTINNDEHLLKREYSHRETAGLFVPLSVISSAGLILLIITLTK